MSPEQAAQNGMTDEVQKVSIFIIQTDTAISSYLQGLKRIRTLETTMRRRNRGETELRVTNYRLSEYLGELRSDDYLDLRLPAPTKSFQHSSHDRSADSVAVVLMMTLGDLFN